MFFQAVDEMKLSKKDNREKEGHKEELGRMRGRKKELGRRRGRKKNQLKGEEEKRTKIMRNERNGKWKNRDNKQTQKYKRKNRY